MTLVRASPRREAFTVCAPGDARLSALHRGGLLASGPARDESLATLPSLSDHWACELLASARNGGGRVSGRLPGVCLHQQTRGTPHPALLKQCLAISTLGGRDGTTIDMRKRSSNYFDVMGISLMIAMRENAQ